MIGFLMKLVPAGGPARAVFALVCKPFAAAWRWVMAEGHRPVILLLLGWLVAHWLILDPALLRERDAAREALGKARASLAAEKAAHAATIRNHKQASAQAQAAQAANLARVAAEQDGETQRIAQLYEDDLVLLRRRRDHLAEQLRQASAGAPGVSSAVHVSSPGEGPARASQASGDQGLPAAVCTPMTLDERFTASAQALQLDALIDWVEAQSALEMNP